MAGPLSTAFGVCANGSAPTDGQVVSFDHGCGAHSDVRVEQSQHTPSTAPPALDTVSWINWDSRADTWSDAELEIISR
jgi:hypothetical protein